MEKPHKKLVAWQESMSLVYIIYELVKRLPRSEEFGLTSQMRRAAVSITANIAEGAARQTTRELLQFLYIARGSLSELDTYMEIVKHLRYIEAEKSAEIDQRMERVDKMLAGLMQSLKRKNA